MASWVGDSIEEFKKAPTGGKVALVAIFVLVGGIGFYEYNKSKSSSSGVSGNASPSTDTTGGGASQYPIVPGSGQGNVPVLPGGLSAIFDPLGNLIGWQPTPTPTPTPTPAPKPGTRGGRLPPVPNPNPPPKHTGKEPEKGTDLGGHRDTQAGRDVGNNHSHMNNRVQPPTGTPRGSKPGPGQQSRPVPTQPNRRGLHA